MRKLLNRWRLTSLNISILRPFVKSIDVFASLISILSSVALVICACFICFILIPCSYNYYVWYYWNFYPVLFLFSHWIQWCHLFKKYLLYWLYSCLYQAFLKCMILCKKIVLLYWNNYFCAEFFHNSFKRSYFINWITICKTLIWIY